MKPPWDAPSWQESGDNAWARGCRLLQGWWREELLQLPPGPKTRKAGDRLVVSMLALDAPAGANFLTEDAYRAALDRLAGSSGAGIVAEDRLKRNLLSSQPACFNLFGPFVGLPALLLPWVQSIDPSCVTVESLEFEWAPSPARHFKGGSAFDAAIFYTDGSGRCFLGVECKYSEDLRKNDPRKVRDVYRSYTDDSGYWREGAARRLDRPGLRQLWINTLLAQSICDRDDFERGTHVVVACAADVAAAESAGKIRTELHDPDRWLRWSPYEQVLEALASTADPTWSDQFLQRYCDFGPVAHLLTPDDPRLEPPEVMTDGLSDLLSAGRRVTGDGSVLEQILEALTERRLTVDEIDLRALNARAAELAIDLKMFRQTLADPHGQIRP